MTADIHTGNTNPAAAVAELGTKPDLGMILATGRSPRSRAPMPSSAPIFKIE
jgi:hypothetical protein